MTFVVIYRIEMSSKQVFVQMELESESDANTDDMHVAYDPQPIAKLSYQPPMFEVNMPQTTGVDVGVAHPPPTGKPRVQVYPAMGMCTASAPPVYRVEGSVPTGAGTQLTVKPPRGGLNWAVPHQTINVQGGGQHRQKVVGLRVGDVPAAGVNVRMSVPRGGVRVTKPILATEVVGRRAGGVQYGVPSVHGGVYPPSTRFAWGEGYEAPRQKRLQVAVVGDDRGESPESDGWADHFNKDDDYFILACLVCWLCNPPFGCIALYFASKYQLIP